MVESVWKLGGVEDRSRILRLFFSYLGMYLLVYGFLMERNAPLWDEVFDASGEGMYSYLMADRWGLAAYRFLFGEGFQPYVAGIVAGLWIAAALVVQVTAFRLAGYFSPLVYGAAYNMSISWAFQVVYSHQSDAVALGILCATIAACCLFSAKRGVLGIGLLVLSLSIYQMLLLYYVAVVLALFVFRQRTDGDRIVMLALRGCLVSILSVVAVYGISWGVCRAVAPPAEISARFSGYQASLSCWPDIASAGGIANGIKAFLYWELINLRSMLNSMFGCGYPGQWPYPVALVLLICLLPFMVRELGWQRSAALVIMGLLPYSFYPILLMSRYGTEGALNARMGLAEPVFIGAVWACFVQADKGVFCCLHRNAAVCCLLVFSILKGAYKTSNMAREEMRIQHAMYTQYHEMGIRARLLSDQGEHGNPVVLVCQEKESSHWGEGPRMSIYDKPVQTGDLVRLDVYPPGVFKAFADYCGEPQLKVASEADLERHQEVLSEMPSWPKAGSVRKHQGEIIIKLNW